MSALERPQTVSHCSSQVHPLSKRTSSDFRPTEAAEKDNNLQETLENENNVQETQENEDKSPETPENEDNSHDDEEGEGEVCCFVFLSSFRGDFLSPLHVIGPFTFL